MEFIIFVIGVFVVSLLLLHFFGKQQAGTIFQRQHASRHAETYGYYPPYDAHDDEGNYYPDRDPNFAIVKRMDEEYMERKRNRQGSGDFFEDTGIL